MTRSIPTDAPVSTRTRILTLLSEASYADWLACGIVAVWVVMLVLVAGVL